jgi:hypothetical protein
MFSTPCCDSNHISSNYKDDHRDYTYQSSILFKHLYKLLIMSTEKRKRQMEGMIHLALIQIFRERARPQNQWQPWQTPSCG